MKRLLVLAAVLILTTPVLAQHPAAELSPLPADFLEANRIEYTSLGKALRNGYLNLHTDQNLDLSEDTKSLVRGLEMVLKGRNRDALIHFDSLAAATTDQDIAGAAGGFAAQIRFDEGEYATVAGIFGDGSAGRLVRRLATLQPQRILPAGLFSDRLSLGVRGHPAIEVSVNGNTEEWWFDTGAGFTSVSESVAREMGIRSLPGDPIEIETATSITVPATVGVIDSMRLGEVLVVNHPVLIFPDESMAFELSEGDSLVIRGIVGWPLIRKLRTTLDYVNGVYSATISTPHEYGTRNFSWIGYPFVRLASADGQPLIFGLDTGSGNTSIAPNILDKLEFGSIRSDTVPIGGLGGFDETAVQIVDSLHLALTGLRVSLPDVRTETASGADDIYFFTADGVLGSDIAQHGVLTVDFPNGYLGLEISRSDS